MTDFHTHLLAEAQFPLKEEISYLNHAAVSPWPLCAQKKLNEFALENISQGASSYPKWLKVEQALRTKLKHLINADSTKEIALSKNTSEALSIIAYGLTWKAGDQVIISNHEFPSNRIVWESLAQYGVELKIADFNTPNPEERIIELINSDTKLVSISSVQYASGISVDLARISQACHASGALFCVDAIQSLGAMPFDQQSINADFIVADGHKWMMGAEGLALLYVKQSVQDLLELKQFGWHMVKQRGNYDSPQWEPAGDATRFECGSPNMLGAHVLDASLGLLLDIGINDIHTSLLQRVQYLESELSKIPEIKFISPLSEELRAEELTENARSGIITFDIEGHSNSAIHQSLMSKDIICANRGGGIRWSPHFYTDRASLDRAVAAIKQLIL